MKRTRTDELHRPVGPGKRVTIKRGVYRGRTGFVAYQVTHPGDDRALTGRCMYAVCLDGHHDASGYYYNACDFQRHEFSVHSERDKPSVKDPTKHLRPGTFIVLELGDEFDPSLRASRAPRPSVEATS